MSKRKRRTISMNAFLFDHSKRWCEERGVPMAAVAEKLFAMITDFDMESLTVLRQVSGGVRYPDVANAKEAVAKIVREREEFTQKVVDMYKTTGTAFIAIRLNVPRVRVIETLRRAGVPIRKRGQWP